MNHCRFVVSVYVFFRYVLAREIIVVLRKEIKEACLTPLCRGRCFEPAKHGRPRIQVTMDPAPAKVKRSDDYEGQ